MSAVVRWTMPSLETVAEVPLAVFLAACGQHFDRGGQAEVELQAMRVGNVLKVGMSSMVVSVERVR